MHRSPIKLQQNLALLATEAYAGAAGGGEMGGMNMDWISVKDRMPKSGEKVIALLQSKTLQRYRTITMLAHIGEHEKTTDDYDWRDCECDTEYDEEKDCYWVKECWYEVNVVDDNPNWIIDSDYNVTHWMPLPSFPTEKKE